MSTILYLGTIGTSPELAARLAKAAQGVPVHRRGEFTLAARMKA